MSEMNRKQKRRIAAIFLLFSIVVFSVSVQNSRETDQIIRTVETLARSENPGTQGYRSTQLVICILLSNPFFATGCCLGSEDCYTMNPCKGEPFSCDGATWIDPE